MPLRVSSVEDAVAALRRLLGGAPCAVAVDVDGTLTVERRRGSFEIHLGAVAALREAEAAGVATILVTGNSAQVAGGLARYLGSRGPRVAENGCVVQHRGRLYSACRGSARAAARIVEEEVPVLTPSWQNPCRLHDYAFLAPLDAEPGDLIDRVKTLLEARGARVKVHSSGYAIHLRPLDASKGKGLRLALRLLGLDPGCTIALGDSAIDLEMGETAAALAAVGNGEQRLLQAADIVVEGRSGAAAETLLRAAARLAQKT